jgi:hypothetical protein
MTPLDQVIDHAAQLQRRLDQHGDQLLFCHVAILALALLVGLLTVRLWLTDHE